MPYLRIAFAVTSISQEEIQGEEMSLPNSGGVEALKQQVQQMQQLQQKVRELQAGRTSARPTGAHGLSPTTAPAEEVTPEKPNARCCRVS